MQLTNAQRLTLKSFIQNDATLGPRAAAGDYDFVANALNAAAAGPFFVWRSYVSEDEFVQTSGVDVANGNAATVWSWVGAGYITRAQGERDAWTRIFRNGGADPGIANNRQAFTDILSGATAPAPANRNHLLCKSKRAATLAEKQLASGTGTFATPATLGVFATAATGSNAYCEGTVAATDVGGILA